MSDDSSVLDALPWVIVGAGRLGRMMALHGRSHGYDVEFLWNHSAQGARATRALFADEVSTSSVPLSEVLETFGERTSPIVVWMTLVDDVLPSWAARVREVLPEGSLLLHTSGSLSSRVFESSPNDDVYVGSLHPLLAVSDSVKGLAAMSSCTWTVEGDDEVVAFGERLLAGIGVTPLRIKPEAKVLYHAAAVTSAGLLVALMDVAFSVGEAAGIEDGDVLRKMLLPLAQSTIENLQEQSTRRALTGPIARGDVETIRNHLTGLSGVPDENVMAVYRALTRRSLGLSMASEEKKREIDRVLDDLPE